MSSIFERYGGFAQVRGVVSEFYDRVLESSILWPYFDEIDMKTLIEHQTKFIAFLMGGPASYSDEGLKRMHEHLNITEEAALEMGRILRETLEDFYYEDRDVAQVYSNFMSRTRMLVKRG
jgi:hemoglobin